MNDTLLLIVLCIGITSVLSFAYAYATNYDIRRKAQIEEYERKYRMIQCHIEAMPVTPKNYDSIERMLICLGRLPHRNKEKTAVLMSQFYIRFQSERVARLTGEEFTPEQIFRVR